MKQILKYSSEIDWDYNLNSNDKLQKKFLNIRAKEKSKADKKKLKNPDYGINYSKHKKSPRQNMKQGHKNRPFVNIKSKPALVVYYGVLFTFVFGFLFFLTISIGFASPLREGEYTESNIYNMESSVKLLEDFIFNTNREKDTGNEHYNAVTSEATFFNYRVKKNDSFEKIAKKFNLSLDTIYLVNDIKKKTILKAGRVLVIPNQDGRIISVKKNDSIFKLANRYGIRWEKIVDANNLESSVIYPNMKLFIPGSKMTNYEKNQFDIMDFIWPIRGRITSYFGSRIDPITGVYGFHSGIDIKNNRGALVKSCNDGKVIFVGWQKIYGNFVIIRHNNGMISTYAHLDSIDVEKSQYIKQGGRIGRVGSSGRSTGPHLHFELRKDGKLIDPLKYLP